MVDKINGQKQNKQTHEQTVPINERSFRIWYSFHFI